jgi:heptosyltransferase-3
VARLLAIRPGGVGDCLLSFPAIESLRSRCDYLEVWVPSAIVPLVHFADRVRAISSTGLDMMGIPGVPIDAGLKRILHGFDAIVSWYGANREEFQEATREFPFEFHSSLPPDDCAVHACDFFCAQLKSATGMTPSIPVDRAKRRHFVAIHPFSGSAKKNWPLEWFDMISQSIGIDVEWCATPEQSGQMGSRRPLLAVADLATVARWLSEARVYVGNDSGITHLAAAVGTPVVAVFCASDARLWAPRGPRVEVLESPSAAEVIAAVRSLCDSTSCPT